MKNLLETEIESLCEDLFGENQNSVLLYGKPEHTLAILTGVYERAKKKEEFLCSWHDASKITKPMDFFEPILRLKYGDGYESLREEEFFKRLVGRDGHIFQLARTCGRDESSESQNAQRLPVIFIDGVEELFFNMDYWHLSLEEINKVITSHLIEQPLPKGFGDCLRAHLHHTQRAIFYGTVRNEEGIQFKTTLGNYDYLFYGKI